MTKTTAPTQLNFTRLRRPTDTVRIGNLLIGSDYPIRIQSMANTDTNDTEAGFRQALRIIEAGGELVRFTTQGTREVTHLGEIRQLLNNTSEGRDVPLVADVHFNATVADEAAKVVEKVRINPGNYIDPARKFIQIDYTDATYQEELQRLRERFVCLLNICKQYHTALRIGVNHGSLSDRIMSRYGDTPAGMVESCMEFLRICREESFTDVIISIKASNTGIMVTTVRLLIQQMNTEGMRFPLHLGVTEAGDGEDGRIKSAVGIGALLSDGIGDTIRVSLSEDPEAEIPVAKALVDYFEKADSPRYSQVTCTIDNNINYNSEEDTTWELFALHAAADLGKVLFDTGNCDLHISNPHFSSEQCDKLVRDILQATRLRLYKTEYISCPSCGRTLFDLQQRLAEVKQATQHLTGLKIAVMGCIVNGPGEMADADYGYVGAGRGKVSLYHRKQCVLKNIPQEEAIDALIELIRQNSDWKDA
ncbi:MAG: (E)-4-hydroxy-3-methylbut-2-enyl-diphosphate synthase [Paludibacter sp.]|nr:(E)-4-hydroxy-3-methylbut-2-enyl-diphosphate synthase [Bacteroidales bacterium]MCM1069410.1 (E)-4-hydroxy-3-methylbut-2-enyl-diphosphate synthase [Prevotella sp.]MCM1353785.1 (E)-4-hydroxy-3-methylbut-2-enyl-diphosphate synthase [Bacteroides sp.]MCM1442814.1 (E)-4-hydroxy-3-methylbut-2-enyl-diphosphate synthase [Muribaculum sp.]MCM1481820.1 (E)-4-hydroxy-3-methylbut-2-enyl-diphosphate synthase [Paludibacter sp.]